MWRRRSWRTGLCFNLDELAPADRVYKTAWRASFLELISLDDHFHSPTSPTTEASQSFIDDSRRLLISSSCSQNLSSSPSLRLCPALCRPLSPKKKVLLLRLPLAILSVQTGLPSRVCILRQILHFYGVTSNNQQQMSHSLVPAAQVVQ